MRNALAVAGLLAPLAATPQVKDETTPVDTQNLRMRLAIDRAQRELPGFLAEHANPKSTARDFKVKVMFASGGAVEHMWVTPFRPTQRGFEGKLKNQPSMVRSLQWGQEVQFERSQITDWAYIKDGRQYGHYTTCIVLAHKGPVAAASEARAMGLSCEP